MSGPVFLRGVAGNDAVSDTGYIELAWRHSVSGMLAGGQSDACEGMTADPAQERRHAAAGGVLSSGTAGTREGASFWDTVPGVCGERVTGHSATRRSPRTSIPEPAPPEAQSSGEALSACAQGAPSGRRGQEALLRRRPFGLADNVSANAPTAYGRVTERRAPGSRCLRSSLRRPDHTGAVRELRCPTIVGRQERNSKHSQESSCCRSWPWPRPSWSARRGSVSLV